MRHGQCPKQADMAGLTNMKPLLQALHSMFVGSPVSWH